LGGYGAMNRAVRETSAELVAVYHADDLYDPQIVGREVAFLTREPGVGAVFCLDRFSDHTGREYGRLELPPDVASRPVLDLGQLTDFLLRYKNTFLRTPSVMFRRAMFDRLGGFDQERYGIAADLDMWLRLSLESQIGLIPEHLYRYRHFEQQWSRVYDRMRTDPELFFAIMDQHLSRPGVRPQVSAEALTLYRIWRVKDEAERAANLLVLGDPLRAVALLNTSLVRPLLKSSRPGTVARILGLRSLVRVAARWRNPFTRAAVYLARFRRLPPRRLESAPAGAAHTLAPDHTGSSRPAAGDLRIFLDPFSTHFYGNGLFDPQSKYNRDNALRPWFYLRERLAGLGLPLDTADYLVSGAARAKTNVYVSFGVRDHCATLAARSDVLLNAFYLFEVVVVEPDMYRAIPDLQSLFRTVYAWTDAASLAPFVRGSLRLKPFRIPMPYEDVIEPHWSRRDRAGIVLVSSNKRAALEAGELYTERLRALKHFSARGGIDLWGRLWEDGLGPLEGEFGDAVRRSLRGPVADKYQALARYRFSVCFENMILPGWITEKIFDCFYAGVVPVYLGAPDVADYIPKDTFVDPRDFPDYHELQRFLEAVTPAQLEQYRVAARDFLRSERFQPFSATGFADRFIEDIAAQLRERGQAVSWD